MTRSKSSPVTGVESYFVGPTHTIIFFHVSGSTAPFTIVPSKALRKDHSYMNGITEKKGRHQLDKRKKGKKKKKEERYSLASKKIKTVHMNI